MICHKQLLRFLVLTGLLISSGQLAAAWPDALDGCQIFAQENEQAARVVFAAGPMMSGKGLTAVDKTQEPNPPLIDAGKLKLTVYDCSKRKTAFGVASSLRRQLRATGWQRDFSCDGTACGPRKGWEKLLPELRAKLPQGSYSYALAHKATSSRMDRIAFLAVDLDDRPRILVQRLYVDPADSIKQELDLAKAMVVYQRWKPDGTVLFQPGLSSTATDLAIIADTQDQDANWLLIGHTDRRGSEQSNGLLAWQRARHIAALLKDLGVAESMIEIISVGSLLPSVDGTSEADRRVDMFRLQANPEVSGSLLSTHSD